LDWYAKGNLLRRIPAVGSVQEIAGRVRKALGR
jgi:hypothetical protein